MAVKIRGNGDWRRLLMTSWFENEQTKSSSKKTELSRKSLKRKKSMNDLDEVNMLRLQPKRRLVVLADGSELHIDCHEDDGIRIGNEHLPFTLCPHTPNPDEAADVHHRNRLRVFTTLCESLCVLNELAQNKPALNEPKDSISARGSDRLAGIPPIQSPDTSPGLDLSGIYTRHDLVSSSTFGDISGTLSASTRNADDENVDTVCRDCQNNSDAKCYNRLTRSKLNSKRLGETVSSLSSADEQDIFSPASSECSGSSNDTDFDDDTSYYGDVSDDDVATAAGDNESVFVQRNVPANSHFAFSTDYYPHGSYSPSVNPDILEQMGKSALYLWAWSEYEDTWSTDRPPQNFWEFCISKAQDIIYN